jgi:hypothetical protein
MGIEIRAYSLQILERISKDGSMFFLDGDESSGLLIYELIAYDHWGLSIPMKKNIEKPIRQRFELSGRFRRGSTVGNVYGFSRFRPPL